MDRVAAEIAEEIGVFFQQSNFNTGARQQKPQHHSGGAAAGDAALRGNRRISHPYYMWTSREIPGAVVLWAWNKAYSLQLG